MNKINKYKLKLDYTADELKELRILGEYNSPMIAVWLVVEAGSSNDQFRNLRAKYFAIGREDELDFMADVNNVVMGTAILPEKKYVVHDKVTDQYIYCNVLQGNLHWWQLGAEKAEKKTKDEWLAINPAYETMLERVED